MRRGFTIVELLIVIVVVGILAAITVAAFNGVQLRAKDSAVQSDVMNLAKLITAYEVENGSYPIGGAPPGNRTLAITFRATKPAYDPSTVNLYYCQGDKGGQPSFSIVAQSPSLQKVIYRKESGLTVQTGGGSVPSVCYAGYDGGVYTITQGYHSNPSIGWASWVID